MKCPQCGGPITYDKIFEKEAGIFRDEWRCLHCAERFILIEVEGVMKLIKENVAQVRRRQRQLKFTRRVE
jgi:hypothetical protein